eukprot:213528-Heterocapsa_arctica.AAC.1
MIAGFPSGARVDADDGAEAEVYGGVRRPSFMLRFGAGSQLSPPLSLITSSSVFFIQVSSSAVRAVRILILSIRRSSASF